MTVVGGTAGGDNVDIVLPGELGELAERAELDPERGARQRSGRGGGRSCSGLAFDELPVP